MTPMKLPDDPAEIRFRRVFEHLQAVADYAARRGSADPEGLAAETMAIAWRRLDHVPVDNPRPWLFVTTRNLLMAERRRTARQTDAVRLASQSPVAAQVATHDPTVTSALRGLAPRDREALLLIAWDDLTPAQAAESLGITAVAFRVRLFRARRRLERSLTAQPAAAPCDVVEVKSA